MRILKSILCLTAAGMLALSASAALPSVKLKDLKGKTVDTAQLNNGGKPMIISFFYIGCKPCKRELNAINEYYADWQDETGVKLVAVSIDKGQDAAKVKPFVDGEGWEYDVILDPNSNFMHALGVQTTPHLIILDGEGNIVESHSGYTEGSETQIIKKLREISAKKPAKKPVKKIAKKK